MNLIATQDNVVLRPVMAGNKSAGGIVLPNQGTFEDGAVVISIGPKVEDIAIGDIVVRPDPCRYDISDDDTGEIFLICAEVDILAKMLPDREPLIDPARLLPEVSDAIGETEKTEDRKEMEGGEEGQVHVDRVQKDRVANLLALHPTERLPENNGN